MSLLKRIIIGTALACSVASYAADCEIGIGISPFVTEGDKVPAGIINKLQAKLKMALAHNGVAAGDYDCQFFITGRFDENFSQEAGGVGGRVMVKSDLQLAICDGEAKKVFAIATFPLKGVGATNEQALTRALGSLNAKNPEFINFVDNAKKKIIDYFDANYPTYLAKAKRALGQRDYDEALYWATMVPECCKGFNEANALSDAVFMDKINYEGAQLLAQAEGEWAANPNPEGAAAAAVYLGQIDPSSSAFAGAEKLRKTMGTSIKADQDFENKEKYKIQADLEKRRIESARQIGIAWAKNQPKTIVRHNWIVW